MTIAISATRREIGEANAFAREFFKEPIAVDDESVEVCGFLIWQDGSDPVMSNVTIGQPDPAPIPGRFRWVVEAPCTRPATYWEPEESDTEQMGRADTLQQALSIVAHAMLDEEIRNFNECFFYEQLNAEANATT